MGFKVGSSKYKGRMLTTRPSPKSKIVLRYLLQLKCSIVEEKQSRHNQEFKTFEGLGHGYRHLREIVCLLTKVGGPATVYSHGTESGDKSIHWPRIEHQSMFNGGQQHNYYCQQRQASWANGQSISLDVCGQWQWLSSSERSLATSEVRGSNPIIGTFLHRTIYLLLTLFKIRKKIKKTLEGQTAANVRIELMQKN